MTFSMAYFTNYAGKNFTTLLSDIVLSVDWHQKGVPWGYKKNILLPHMPTADLIQLGNKTISELGQKIVLFDRSSFQYSGNKMLAELVLKKLYQLTESGTKYHPLSDAINQAGLSDNQKRQISILTHFCESKDNIKQCSHFFSCGIIEKGGQTANIYVQGSGVNDFFAAFEPNPHTVGADIQYDLMHRFAMRTIAPWFGDYKTLEDAYGSWFEFASYSNLNFKKMPTAFKFWPRNPDTGVYEANSFLMYSQYIEHDLFIFSLLNGQDEKSGVNFFHLPDPLQRGKQKIEGMSQNLLDSLRLNPELVFHILLDFKGGGEVNFQLLPMFIQGDCGMSVDHYLKEDGTPAAAFSTSPELANAINDWANE